MPAPPYWWVFSISLQQSRQRHVISISSQCTAGRKISRLLPSGSITYHSSSSKYLSGNSPPISGGSFSSSVQASKNRLNPNPASFGENVPLMHGKSPYKSEIVPSGIPLWCSFNVTILRSLILQAQAPHKSLTGKPQPKNEVSSS